MRARCREWVEGMSFVIALVREHDPRMQVAVVLAFVEASMAKSENRLRRLADVVSCARERVDDWTVAILDADDV